MEVKLGAITTREAENCIVEDGTAIACMIGNVQAIKFNYFGEEYRYLMAIDEEEDIKNLYDSINRIIGKENYSVEAGTWIKVEYAGVVAICEGDKIKLVDKSKIQYGIYDEEFFNM